MTYTNTPAVVSQQTTSYSSGNIPYSSIAVLADIPHSAQLEVERIFTTDRDGSASTILTFLSDPAITTAQKKAVFIIPITRCTLNTTTKNITAINLPQTGDVYNYIAGAYTIKVPILSSSTVTVRRKTVSNEPLVNWVPGSRLTSKQLNLSTTQSLYLIQEALENIGTSLTIQTTQITAASLAVDAVNTINILNGAVTSAKIADGTIVNADINASAGIVDTKLATIATSGKVSNSATTATTSTTAATIALRDSNGVGPSAFIQTGTGATARTVDDKLKETVSVKDFGAIGDNVTDDTAAINAAIAFCNTNSQTLFIPRGNYKITSNITVPIAPNTQRSFGIIGEGKHSQSVLNFTGAAITTGLSLISAPGIYQYRGLFQDFMLYFNDGATGGFTISYAHHPQIDNIHVSNTSAGGSGSAGITLDNCNAPSLSNCLITSCGSTTKGAVYLNKCTVAIIEKNYITGQTFAGIQIERSTATTFCNAVESTGYLLLAGEESESVFGVKLTSQFDNLENPTGSFIRFGRGLTSGAANESTLDVSNGTGSPSGSTSINYIFDIGSVSSVDLRNNSFYGDTVATIALTSVNTDLRIFRQRGLYKNPTIVPFITIGGTHLLQATAIGDLDISAEKYGLAIGNQSITVTTSTINNAIVNGAGGLYSRLYLTTTTPITVNDTLNYPTTALSIFATGAEITIFPLDNNLTIAHNVGGSGGFILRGGVNLTLVNNQAYKFLFNNNTGKWTEI